MRGYLSDSQRKNFGTPIVREVIIKANNDARYDVLHKIRCPAAERAEKEWRRRLWCVEWSPPIYVGTQTRTRPICAFVPGAVVRG